MPMKNTLKTFWRFTSKPYASLIGLPVSYAAGIATAKFQWGWEISDSSGSIIGAFIGALVAIGGSMWLWQYQQNHRRRESIRVLWGVLADLGYEADCAREGVNAAQGQIATGKLIRERFLGVLNGAEKKLQRLQTLSLNLGPNTANQLLNCEVVIAQQIRKISDQAAMPESAAMIGLIVQAAASKVNVEIDEIQRLFSLVVTASRTTPDNALGQ